MEGLEENVSPPQQGLLETVAGTVYNTFSAINSFIKEYDPIPINIGVSAAGRDVDCDAKDSHDRDSSSESRDSNSRESDTYDV